MGGTFWEVVFLSEAGGQAGGSEEAAGVGLTLPCDVEGGTVIDAGARHGQAEGRVDGGIEGDHFDGNMPLIVVHANHRVVLFSSGRNERGIGWDRARDICTVRPSLLDRRHDRQLFFTPTEQPAFARVRIQATDQQFRLLSLDAAQGVSSQFDHIDNPFDGQPSGNVQVADMYGDERAGEQLGVLHHAKSCHPHTFGEDLGVPWETVPGGVESRFVQRSGRHTNHLTGHGGIDAGLDVPKSRCTAPGIDSSWGYPVRLDLLQIQHRGLLNLVPGATPIEVVDDRGGQLQACCSSDSS